MGRNLGPLNIKDSYEGLVQISGSQLTDGSGSLIPSLDVSASFATSASYAVTASFALNAGASTLQEVLDNSNTATGVDIILTGSYQRASGSFSGNVIDNITDTYTGTDKINHVVTLTQAEYNALTPDTSTFYVITDAAATMITGSVVDATLTFTKDDATTFPLTVNNVANAVSASFALTASSLEGGVSLQTVLDTGNTATQDLNLTGDLDVVGTLDLGGTGNSISGVAGSAIVVGSNQTISAGGDNGIYSGINNTINSQLYNAIVGGNGNTVSHARSVVIGGTGLSTTKADEVVVPSLVANSITASFASFTSASIGSLRTVTGSAVIIGDEFIILNADTPTARYAGLIVYDSGSGTPATASFEWDGLSDNWVIVEESGNSGVVLTGPTGSKGSEVLPTVNTLQKGGGHHTLLDSSITDDGTLVTINANVSASGYVSASEFIGDGSKLTGLTTDPFPYTGSAEISGSLKVIGQAEFASNPNSDITNTSIGAEALQSVGASTLGTTAIGYQAGKSIVNGSAGGYHTLIGWQNGRNINDTNYYTVGVGAYALNSLTSGRDNTVVGTTAGYTLTTQEGNALFGKQAGINLAGEKNTLIGRLAGQNLTSANNNTFVGEEAGGGITTGDKNTVVGRATGLTSTLANNIILADGDGNIAYQYDNASTTTTVTGTLAITGITDVSASIAAAGGGGAAEWQAGTAASSSVSLLNNTPSQIAATSPYSLLYSSGSAITSTNGWNVNLGGQDNQLGGGGFGAVIIGGLSNEITDNFIGSIIGGRRNDMQSYAGIIAGASDCTVDGGFHGFAIGTDTSQVVGNIDNCGILGGDTNTVSHSNSVIVGGQNLSTTKADEVVVPSLDINGTVVQSVQALTITSNTASLDASTGQMFTLGLQNAADTHLELSNQVAGQTFSLKITNNATAAGTISFDSQFDFEGGTAFTATAATNAVDILTFTTFDGSNVQCVGSKNFS